jgi:hypothetical protein
MSSFPEVSAVEQEQLKCLSDVEIDIENGAEKRCKK